MTVPIQQVSNTNTFHFWLARTNELANVVSTKAVTVNSDTATGNAAITGTFTANTVSAKYITIETDTTVNRVIAGGAVGTNNQVLTSNGNGTAWKSLVYTGTSAVNVDYPIGSTVSVYTGATEKTVSSTQDIYTDNLNGIEGATGSKLTGTWRNRGLCGLDYRSPSEKYYYYLYQRVE